MAAISSVMVVQGASSSRNVVDMSKWATDKGIAMHENLEWKEYGENNWGLELKKPVPPGTLLLQVPRNVVLDADCIRNECIKNDGADKLDQALQCLGEYAKHEEGFLIFLKLLRCSKQSDSEWSPWIQALPTSFPEFSVEEKECLPFYAKYAAEYQEKKFQAFCQAAAILDTDERDLDRLKWAFHCVGSRCWKTEPINENETSNTELVPVGDMFNHREPPNVAITHDDDCVNFIYKGDADKDNKDLYITYGSPSNPHRFLAIFGFVPQDMPQVWSHVAYPNNPFSADVPNMVFNAKDGRIPKIVWDAVLFALLQPPTGTTPVYTKEQHVKYKKFTLDVLKTHVAKQLEELTQLEKKMENIDGENLDLIRQHNQFLTRVFSKVHSNLESSSDDELFDWE